MRRIAVAAAVAVTLALGVAASAAKSVPQSGAEADVQQGIGADLLCKFLGSGTAATVAVKLRNRISPGLARSAILSAVVGATVVTCPHWAPKAAQATEKLVDWLFGSRTPPPSSDRDPPIVFAPQSAVRGDWNLGTGGAVGIATYWSAFDLGKGVDAYQFKVFRNGGWALVRLPNNTIPNMTISVDSGGTYQFAARARDFAGNWSSWVAGRVLKVVTYNDAAARYSDGWSHNGVSGAVDGDVTFTRLAGATATLSFNASVVTVVASQFPQSGAADFWIDGRYVGRRDLYSSTFIQRGVVFAWQWPTFGSHNLTIRNVAYSGRAELQLDAFVLLGK
jgi:hypothetical protein